MVATDQLAFADGLYRRGLFDLAAQEYQRLVEAHPDAPEASSAGFRLGESRRQLGDAPAARAAWERTAARHADREGGARANLRLAQAHLDANQPREAAARARQALAAADLPPEVAAAATYELGRGLLGAGDRNGAIQAWTSVATQKPPSSYAGFAQLALGQALQGSDAPAAARWLTQAEASGPTDRVRAESVFLRAELAQTREAHREAAELFDRLIKAWPNDPRAGAARLGAAWAWLRGDRPAPARDRARKELAGNAAPAPAWLYLLANAARQLGDWKEADDAYRRLMETAPKDPLAAPARFERAVMALQQGQPDLAVGLLRDGATPAGPEAEWVLAEALAQTRNVPAAVEAYRKVIAAAPQAPRAVEARFRIAQVSEQAERWAEAATAYREFAQAHRDHPQAEAAWFRSAACALRAGQSKAARDAFAAQIQAFPKGPLHDESTYRLALLDLQAGEATKAAPRLQALAGGKGDFAAPSAWVLATIRDQANDLESAAAHYRQALAAQPPPAPKAEILNRLAGVLTRQAKPDEAAQAFALALKEGAEGLSPDVLEWVARTSLASGRSEDARIAAAALGKVASAGPAQAAAGWIGGEAARVLGRLDDARRDLARAAAVPADAGGLDGLRAALALGRIHLEAKQPQAAEPLFRQAVERSGAAGWEALRAEAYFGLAECAEARTQWADAARLFLAVAVLYDDAHWAPRALARAADAFGQAGQADRRQAALDELRQRYPAHAPESPAP